MKQMIFQIAFILLFLAAGVRAESIYNLIREGEIKQAVDSLSQVSTAALRNGNNLFFQSLLESDGARAASLMEAALNASVSHRYREEIHFRLAQYYFVAGNYRRLQRTIADYRATWENGRYRSEILRYSAAVDEHAGENESALRQTDRYLLEYTGNESQWGIIDKARAMLANNKRIGAAKTLRRLARESEGPGVPLALYLLTTEAVRDKRADDAVLYYNILREGYPAAVGLAALVDRMADMTAGTGGGSEAEKLTGTYYSVQVGVFSESGNAKRQANLMKKYGHKVDTKTKTISGVQYRVVYVGRFATYQEAAAVKAALEAEHHEVFQVVAR